MKHPADGGRWDQTLRLCESRIAKRGEGHRTLKASPQLRGILQRTVTGKPLMDGWEILFEKMFEVLIDLYRQMQWLLELPVSKIQ